MLVRCVGVLEKWLMLVLLTSLLSACGGFSLWPFGDDEAQTTSRGPAGSTEYQCDKGRKFYVKLEDGGNSAWLVLPDREVSLNKTDGGQYSNGITKLAIEGETAKLDEGYKRDYVNCQASVLSKKK